MQRILEGSAPESSSRSTRSVSTLVLPVPALADTHAEMAGSEAICWSWVIKCAIIIKNIIERPGMAGKDKQGGKGNGVFLLPGIYNETLALLVDAHDYFYRQ